MPDQNRRMPPILLERARALRQRQTAAETILWKALRNRALAGFKFRRQHRIGYYIVDFYCFAKKLVIEVDGGSHIGREAYDARRTDFLESLGCTVIRFTNEQVFENETGVLEEILRNLTDISDVG